MKRDNVAFTPTPEVKTGVSNLTLAFEYHNQQHTSGAPELSLSRVSCLR